MKDLDVTHHSINTTSTPFEYYNIFR